MGFRPEPYILNHHLQESPETIRKRKQRCQLFTVWCMHLANISVKAHKEKLPNEHNYAIEACLYRYNLAIHLYAL